VGSMLFGQLVQILFFPGISLAERCLAHLLVVLMVLWVRFGGTGVNVMAIKFGMTN